jgi:hypothetical protein
MAKRKSIKIEFKRSVLEWIYEDEDNPKTSYAAERHFCAQGHNITKQAIHGWLRKRNEIFLNSDKKSRRLSGGGNRTALPPEVEDILKGLILEERQEGNRVNGSLVKQWALELAAEHQIEKFNASCGWLDKFLQRNELSFRRGTNLTSLTMHELVQRAFRYMDFLQQKILTPPGIYHSHTVLMDETAVYLEDPRQVSVNEKGRRHVILKSTGFASMRVTVLLSVRPNGTKLTPVIIFKKAKETGLNAERCEGCYVFYNEKAWVNQNLIKKWIDIVFPIIDQTGGRKCLIWDSCKAHTAKLVKEHMIRRGILNVVIPGGLTPYVQAGDLGIYKSFKDKISPIIAAWKNSVKVKRTASGNPKPPEKEVVCRWVREAWTQVEPVVIQNSVRASGFSDFHEWMIWKHDVYGSNFQLLWCNREIIETNETEVLQQCEEDLDELDVVLDEEFDDMVLPSD